MRGSKTEIVAETETTVERIHMRMGDHRNHGWWRARVGHMVESKQEYIMLLRAKITRQIRVRSDKVK